MAASLAGVGFLAAPSGASDVRRVAQLPPGSGDATQIADVSADGQKLLVSTSDSGSLWSVLNDGATVTQMATSGIAPLANQSPSGSYVAWVPRRSFARCAHTALVARTGGTVAPKALKLSGRYARKMIDTIAVADDGSVTVRVGPCQGDPTQHLALLTAAPGASRLTARARYPGRHGPLSWQVSENGRVLVGCGSASKRGRPLTEMSLIDSRAPQSVRVARVTGRTTTLVSCVASDSGIGTLAVIHQRARHRSTMIVTTIGPTHRSTFSLPFNCRTGLGINAASSDGRQVIAGLLGSRIGCRTQRASLIDTRRGRSRSFPAPFRGLSEFSGFAVPNSRYGGLLWWDPFASALVAMDSFKGTAMAFDPRTRRDGPRLKVARPDNAGATTIHPCFLPSGRVLFVAQSRGVYSLTITDPGRGQLTRIDTRQTGPISSVSCEAASSSGDVMLATPSGHLYSAEAASLDGSALKVVQ